MRSTTTSDPTGWPSAARTPNVRTSLPVGRSSCTHGTGTWGSPRAANPATSGTDTSKSPIGGPGTVAGGAVVVGATLVVGAEGVDTVAVVANSVDAGTDADGSAVPSPPTAAPGRDHGHQPHDRRPRRCAHRRSLFAIPSAAPTSSPPIADRPRQGRGQAGRAIAVACSSVRSMSWTSLA